MIYLRPTQFKLCMKVAYRCINLYEKSATVADIFDKLYKMSPQVKSQDQAVAVFISNFLKPQLDVRSKADPKEAEVLLPLIFETLLPQSLDVLGPGADYITDMTQRVQAGLNLLLFLKARYGDHELFTKFRPSLTKKEGLFENLLLAFKTAHDALDSQIADYTKRDVENLDTRVMNFRTSQQVLSMQKEICKDLIAAFDS